MRTVLLVLVLIIRSNHNNWDQLYLSKLRINSKNQPKSINSLFLFKVTKTINAGNGKISRNLFLYSSYK
jgi:hypothetical protein